MSRLNNLYNNIEYFGKKPNKTNNIISKSNPNVPKQNPINKSVSLSTGSQSSASSASSASSTSKVISNVTNKVTDIISEPVKVVPELEDKEDERTDFDEQDDDDLEEENVDNAVNDLIQVDEQDIDELDDNDIESLINSKFLDNPDNDERDDEVYIAPKINLGNRKVDPNLDEKLADMAIDDDGGDDADNIFKMGGANGAKAEGAISGIQQGGDELSNLILAVPIEIITLLIEINLQLLAAILEGPINKIDEYLGPIRDALKGLYSITTPIVLLINGIVGLPFSIGIFAWSAMCNIMKLLGIYSQCNKKYQKNNYIREMYDVITNLNIFRFKDLFFSQEFRDNLFKAFGLFGKKIVETFVLIFKVIKVLTKVIEVLIEGIKQTVKLIEDVTNKDNLQQFAIILVMLGVFYVAFFGINKVASIYSE